MREEERKARQRQRDERQLLLDLAEAVGNLANPERQPVPKTLLARIARLEDRLWWGWRMSE